MDFCPLPSQNNHVFQNFHTMDRGGAPRTSSQAECGVPSAKGGVSNTSPEANQGGRAAEATGDEAGDGARRMGYRNYNGENRREKSDKGGKGCEERVCCTGIGRGGGQGTQGTQGDGLGQAED